MPQDPQDQEDQDELEELEPTEPKTTRRGTSRRSGGRAAGRRRAAPAEKKGGPNPLVIGGIAVAVLGAGAFFMLGGDGEDDKGSGDGDAQAATSPADGANSGKDTTTAANSSKSAKEVYAERMSALTDSDAAGRVELAAFCDEKSWAGSAAKLRREALLIDPNNAAARTALGFVQYNGPATKYRGRWLSENDLTRVKALEKFATGDLAEAATSADVFMRAAEDKKRELSREFPTTDWTYAVGEGFMRQPFLVLIEQTADLETEKFRQEYNDDLSALYDSFFDRYREKMELEEIEAPAVVIIWDSESTYKSHIDKHPDQNYTEPGFVRGYYQPWSQRLILWRGDGLRNVLLHEGAHMLIHYAFSGRGFASANESPWFQEGFAEFFGGHKVEIVGGRKKYVLGQRLPGRERELVMIDTMGGRLSVLDLVKLTSFQFNEAKEAMSDPTKDAQEKFQAQMIVSNVYAQGWALIMYLNHADGGKYVDRFDDYFKAETAGSGHWGKFGELMGLESDDDWQKFDERFKTWTMTSLRKL